MAATPIRCPAGFSRLEMLCGPVQSYLAMLEAPTCGRAGTQWLQIDRCGLATLSTVPLWWYFRHLRVQNSRLLNRLKACRGREPPFHRDCAAPLKS